MRAPFSPEIFTGWGSEGVKQVKRKNDGEDEKGSSAETVQSLSRPDLLPPCMM